MPMEEQEVLLEFQSTHPRGVRRDKPTLDKVARCFNPRTHEGCDPLNTAAFTRLRVSIHAPTRGATDAYSDWVTGFDVSIHAPTRGATLLPVIIICLTLVSIHAPTRGATGNYLKSSLNLDCFNPRTHEGCDCIFCKIQNINIQK